MPRLYLLPYILFLTVFFPSGVYGEDIDKTGHAGIDIQSNYIWRGQKLSENMVLQPSLGVSYKGFKADLWANYDFDKSEHTETDLTLSYEYSKEGFLLEAGYIYYAVDGNGQAETQEVFGSLGYETLFDPSLTLYFDFDEGDGAFIELSLGHSYYPVSNILIDLSAIVSYSISNKTMGTDVNGNGITDFYYGEISLSISFAVSKNILLNPVVSWSFPLSSNAEDRISGASVNSESSILYGGIRAGIDIGG